MDFSHSYSSFTGLLLQSPTTFTSLIASLLLLLIFVVHRRSKTNHLPLPPSPSGSRPILGHLHLLDAKDVLHRVLAKLADENGPIFMLKIGMNRAIVVSNADVTRECLSTNDKFFSDRSPTVAFKTFGYNNAMFLMSPYGPYWREMRKITATQLFSNSRLSELKHTKTRELRASIQELYHLWEENKGPKVKVNLSKWVADLTLNSILNLVAGKSLRGFTDANERDHCHEAFRAFFHLLGVFTVGDALPFLKWLDIGGHEKIMKKAAAELDTITQGWLDDHIRDRRSGLKEKWDFMDLLLDILEVTGDEKFYGYEVNTVIKATCQLMVLAGTDTTTWALIWSVSLLLNHPHILNKAKQELNTTIGKDRLVNDSDLTNLPYIHAIIKEAMRLYPPGPINMRLSTSDAVISGYHIPSGTQIFLNLPKIHRDPRIYPNPDEFLPDRFLGNDQLDVDIKLGQNFEFQPFGGGRRMCPGASYALQAMPIMLANLLHSFDITRPSDELIDMTDEQGVTNAKKTPLEVFLAPNLPRYLYED